MDNFKRKCRENGLKVTPQRTAIYRLLKKNRQHPTADMVFQEIRKTFASISFDTVNRTLVQFARIGLISPLACSGTSRRYDPDTSSHHHMKCNSCGAVEDIFCDSLDSVTIPAKLLKGFEVKSQSIVVIGICKKCSTKGGN